MTIKNINPNYATSNRMPRQMIDAHVQNLEMNSVSCTWEQSFQCPCINTQSNSPKPDCPICHGQGIVFTDPKLIDIAISGDKNQSYEGIYNNTYLPSTLATPQVTSNGIEDGIKPGDRITVNNWYTPQNYLFNITKSRLNKGIFLPYSASEIRRAYAIQNTNLKELVIDSDISLKDNYVSVNNESLLGLNISLILSIEKRYYVTMLVKELRYSRQDSYKQKDAATGYGNKFLTYGQLSEGKPQYNGNQVFKMPNLLSLRRETLYFKDSNIVSSDTDNNLVISDPKVKSFNDFMDGD